MQKEYITNEAWIKMLDFFNKHPRVYLGCKKRLKLFVEAAYWILCSGGPWRMLPEKYGNWNNIFRRFKDWITKNF